MKPEDLLTTGNGDFLWAAGIENTFVPQTRPGHRALDEYELIGHYEHWREDLSLARDLGVNSMRWGVPWYKVEPERGSFDWSWTDEVIPFLVEELKILPIIDLMHYGCPFWLKREFANRDYPKFVAEYAAAFAERYKRWIGWYTPLNEPIINSLMCGMRGLWPPYLKGDKGYIRIMLQLAKGIIHTVKAIKSIDPESVMVHVEATGLTRTVREDLSHLAREEQHRGYLCYDLVSGDLTHDHLLYTWLVRNGASPDDLVELQKNSVELDVRRRVCRTDPLVLRTLPGARDDNRNECGRQRRRPLALAYIICRNDKGASRRGRSGHRLYLVSVIYDDRLAVQVLTGTGGEFLSGAGPLSFE